VRVPDCPPRPRRGQLLAALRQELGPAAGNALLLQAQGAAQCDRWLRLLRPRIGYPRITRVGGVRREEWRADRARDGRAYREVPRERTERPRRLRRGLPHGFAACVLS